MYKRLLLIFLFIASSALIYSETKDFFVSPMSGLVLRQNPSISSEKILIIPYMSSVTVKDINGPKEVISNIEANWYKVDYQGISGWVFSGFLTDEWIDNEINVIFKNIDLGNAIIDISNKNAFIALFPKAQMSIADVIINNSSSTGLVDRLYYANINDKIVIWYAINDGGSSTTNMICFNNKNNKIAWKQEIPGFNLCRPLYSEKYIYYACIGMVGKVDFETGKIVWSHDDLYINSDKLKAGFNAFSSIYIESNSIVFVEGNKQKHLGKKRRIFVDKITGKISEIKVQ